jgi:hypothetical protein
VLGNFAGGIVSDFLEDFLLADATLRVEEWDAANSG